MNDKEIAIAKGKYLERICRLLFEDAGYTLLQQKRGVVKYNGSTSIVEIYGRGTKHQIDLPYEFLYPLPFLNPIQVLGEVKYRNKKIDKSFIREFIGVIDDISQNHVVSHKSSVSGLEVRRLTQGLFISASGFDKEAEKLAYAHNIKLIAFNNNPVFLPILNKIDEICSGFSANPWINPYTMDELSDFDQFFKTRIKSYFLATTTTGHLMYFISFNDFYFDSRQKYYDATVTYSDKIEEENYVQLHLDNMIFHSSLPNTIYKEFIEQNKKYGNAITAKQQHFSPLTIYKMINGNMRIIQIYYKVQKQII